MGRKRINVSFQCISKDILYSMSEKSNCTVEIESFVADACLGQCDPAGNMQKIVETFIVAAVRYDNLDLSRLGEHIVSCQLRCEGIENRGFFRRPFCGMVASLQLFDAKETVILEGTFSNPV